MRIDRETNAVMPEVVAECVVQEVERYLYNLKGYELLGRNDYVANLMTKAEDVFAANKDFEKSIFDAKDNVGRDRLYVFMRHWLAAELKDSQYALYRLLPLGFSVGERL